MSDEDMRRCHGERKSEEDENWAQIAEEKYDWCAGVLRKVSMCKKIITK